MIFNTWEEQGWKEPVIEEGFDPDRTSLLLEFIEKQAKKTSEENKRRKQAKKASEENKRRKQAKKTDEEKQRIISEKYRIISSRMENPKRKILQFILG